MSFASTIESITRKSGDLFLVALSDDYEIAFRLLPYKKLEQYKKLIDSTDSQEIISMIYDEIFRESIEDKYLANFGESIPAGIPESIARLVLFLSGQEEETSIEYLQLLLNANRESVNLFLNVMKRTICSVFSSYKFSDVEELNFQEFVHVFVQAEQVMIEQGLRQDYSQLIDKKKNNNDNSNDIFNQIQKDAKEFNSFSRA